ncbi:SpoIVB peptidase S55 domain-containing protein [Selenomonas sputigena]|uniref:SpoIVB peptidase S55 domain-containing protein n=1 Tax=Selenomonas sputigena TaxID=69823 RepID=UPI00222F75F7|nr:SpoIVB peptidase S55 domain-containing protein [Selenomonas sputigena]UZD44585.1 SpoIVB peptidase S55 domain protein [Selenomonas sputigena]
MIYLRNFKKKMLALGLSLSLSTGVAAAASLPPTLPLSEVYPGMEGTAYTVVDESGEIVPFHVDVVGTYDEGSSTNRIMAKASGPVVERTGGTLQGMSGSPVYVDGALVGALSAGIKGMSLYTFFITPIDEMLPIWDMPDYKAIHLKKEKKEKAADGDEPMGEGMGEDIGEGAGEGGKSGTEQTAGKRAKLEKEELPELAEATAEKPDKKPTGKQGKDSEKRKKAEKEKPAAAEERKDKAEKKPAAAEEKKAKAEKKPAAEKEESAKTEKKPAGEKKKPAEAEKKPAVERERSEEARKKPAEAKENSAETEKRPAETMSEPAKETKEPAEASKKPAEKKPVAEEGAKPAAKKHETQAKSALYLAGFGRSGSAYMEEKLSALGFKAGEMPAFGTPTPGAHVVYDAALAPGSAVGVAVSYGDFSVGATGTVTAVDGKRVLAFGHPFLHKGNVNYFMTDAKVVGTISGPTDGMKIASIGNIIGRINQDREAGVAGIIGAFPESVPMRVRVKDTSLGYDRKFAAQIAYDEDFLPVLVPGIAYAAMGKTSDTLGEATANLKFTIRTTAGEDGKIERSNMYYTASDVGQASVGELAQVMTLLCQNAEEEADVTSVDVDIEMESTRKTASLISAVPEKPSAKPGETVNFRTTIKPFRREKEELLIPYHVPESQAPGVLSLDVRGGSFVPVTAALLQNALGIDTSAEEDKTQTTADKLKQFLQLGRNNEIIVAPAIAPKLPLSAEEKKEAKKRLKKQESAPRKKQEKRIDLLGQKAKKQGNPFEAKFETGYVIDNVIHTSLLIEEEDKR